MQKHVTVTYVSSLAECLHDDCFYCVSLSRYRRIFGVHIIALILFLFVCVQFVRHHSRPQQRAAASHEPVCPDQHGGSSFPLHHLHAHRNQVRINPSLRLRNPRIHQRPSPFNQHSETSAAFWGGSGDVTFPSLLLEIPSHRFQPS